MLVNLKLQLMLRCMGKIKLILYKIEKKMNLYFRIIKKLFKIIGLNPAILSAPYDYVQAVCETDIHRYLGLNSNEIKLWCIVGGYLGKEIPKIKKRYPNVNVTVFECSKRYADKLASKFRSDLKVHIIQKAVSSKSGDAVFFETSLRGSGSLLQLGDLAKESYCAEQEESFGVATISLDDYFNEGEEIDVLQIDVQGAEQMVLEGAVDVLKRTKFILIEVSLKPDLYQNSVIFEDISKILRVYGFDLILLGTDFNLTGNAVFVKHKINPHEACR